MAGIDETIVREFFEANGFLVRQLNKYQVQSRKKRADEEIDLVAENPRAKEGAVPDSFVLRPEDLRNVGRAAVAVRGWHTGVFSVATMKSAGGIFNFLQKSAIARIENLLGSEGRIFKILAIPALPKNAVEREKSVQYLKSRGIDGVLTYPIMLRNIASVVEVNNNYVKSDLLQTLRILKNYDMLSDPQTDMFEK